MHVPTLRSVLASIVLVAMPAQARAGLVTSVLDGRVPCVPIVGAQFCAGSLATRVETWDGVPLDVNVTIPPLEQDGPFPLIVDLHGWGVGKSPQPFVAEAMEGYVVMSYSARGFHNSCGFAPSRVSDPTLTNPNACNERGWIHLADARYEARDTQYLAGLLVDEGLVVPDKIGATGSSYGGGQSMILAALRDRTMLPNGTLVPWTSPGGTPMQIAAAAPLIPWSDLAYALTPNGRNLDYLDFNPYGKRGGVMKKSYVDLLFTLGLVTGFYSAPGADPDADIQTWKARLDAGEPYDTDPILIDVIDEVTAHHSAYYIDDSIPPAPLFIYNAWTDDLFPADEALRFWLKTRANHPSAEISLLFADAFGHPRASLGGDQALAQQRVGELFARHLKGVGAPLPPLEALTQGCNGAPVAGPFGAPDWESIHPGEVRYAETAPKTFDYAGGNPGNASAVDPAGAAVSSCRTVGDADDPGAATYRLPAATGAGYTLMGSPTIIADFDVVGPFAEIAARLWDVAGDGNQTLVAQRLYRPRTDNLGPQVFQLTPNGWYFAAGHVAKLELLGQSSPYGRASNGTFTISVSNLELRLPVIEAPGGAILAPAPPVPPPADAEPLECGLVPATGCMPALISGKSSLSLKHRSGRDRLVWKLRGGPATTPEQLGDPRADTGYVLCIYGDDVLLSGSSAPAGRTCAGAACWAATSRGYRYRDRAALPQGVAKMGLKSGGVGKMAASMRGTGVALEIPALPITTLPVTAQLVNNAGACWETTFSSATQNDATTFKARSN